MRTRRRTGTQRLALASGALISLVLLVGAAGLAYLNVQFGNIERFAVATDVPIEPEEPRNYLLVGSDSRAGLDPDDPVDAQYFDDEGTVTEDSPQRTDTIMVLRVDPETETAALLSLPRDLYVPLADDGQRNRINAAYTRGRDVLIDTIRQNFGIPIHHYVEVNLLGFRGLVEAIGGVPVYFSEPVRDDFSQLRVTEPGCVNLRGLDALAFVRSRHLEIQDADTGRWRSDPTGDFGRITRQQAFIRRAISEAVAKGLSNPVTLNDLVSVGVEFVGLDPGLTVQHLLGLGRRFAAFDVETLQTYSVPATPIRTSAGASVLDLDERAAEPIFNIFRGLDPSEVTPGAVEVTVLNGVGTEGLAGDVTVALERIGFLTGTPGDTDEPMDATVIYFAPGSEGAAQRLARHVSGPYLFGVDEDLDPGEVFLVAGADFTTLHEQPSPEIPPIPTTTTTTAEPGASTTTSTTSTTVVGYLPGEAPPGIDC